MCKYKLNIDAYCFIIQVQGQENETSNEDEKEAGIG